MKFNEVEKKRFKLYKAGKMWLIAGTTFLALAGLGSVAVHADSNNLNTQSAQSTVATNQDVKVESTQSQDNNVVTVQNNDVTTPAQVDSNKQDNSATDSKNATVPAQTDSNKQDNSAADSKNATVPAQTDSNKQDNSAAENKDATPAQTDSNKQDNSATDNKNAADQANSTSVNSDTTSNTNANNQKVALLAADNQPDGWNTDHTQYTQGGQLLTGVHNIDGTYYDFDENHNIVKNNYVQSQWGLWYMFGNDGRIATKVTPWAGTYYYFDPLTYLRVDNNYVQSQWGLWYMFGNDGRIATKVTPWAGTYYYFDPLTYLRVDNNYVQSQWGLWYMFGNNGRIATKVTPWAGTYYYFDPLTYLRVDNNYVQSQWGSWYLFGNDGRVQSGVQRWAGTYYYFDPTTYLRVDDDYVTSQWGLKYMFGKDGRIVSDLYKWDKKNQWYYFDPVTYLAVTNNYIKANDGNWYLFTADGTAASKVAPWAGTYYYFDPVTHLRVDNAYVQSQWGDWYMFGPDGRIVTGLKEWYGSTYYFDPTTYLKVTNKWVNGQYFGADGARYQNKLLVQGSKAYYLDANGNPVRNQTMTIDGTTYHFDANGEASAPVIVPDEKISTDNAFIQKQRSQIAASIADALSSRGNIDADWNNQNDNFAAFAMHDTAQLVSVAQKNVLDKQAGQKVIGDQGLDADANLIEENLAKNALLTGKVQNIFTMNYKLNDFSNSADYVRKVTDDYVNQLKLKNIDGDILGIGSNYDSVTQQFVVTAILFKKGPAKPVPAQATSMVSSATVTNVYNDNTEVNNPLTVGATVDNAELNGALAGINNTILTGPKGEVIPQNILHLYYDALKGAQEKTGLVGQKIYSNKNGDYHYVYWLETNQGTVKKDSWTVFMNNNKGVKYGDPIKVDVSATLTWGKPAAKPVSGIPTSQMTPEQINTAYATGSDTGANLEPVKIEKINNFNNSLAKGVDVGSLIALENAGVSFYNFKGQKDDLFNVLQQAGVNYIRLRIWNDPYNAKMQTYGGGANDEATLIQLAKRAQAHGMAILMDFHYSDFWADPATQLVPKAWNSEDPATMQKSVYNYTKKVLQDLKAAGADVQMVQVGNEITQGILTSQTRPDFWTNESTAKDGCAYLSAGVKATRETLPAAKVLLHLEEMNQDKYRNILTSWKNHGVDFDIFATSAYQFWLWSNDQYSVMDAINGCINMVKNEFGKQTIISETSWPFTTENSDGTNNSTNVAGNAKLPISPQGQTEAMRRLYSSAMSNGNILGTFWWEPAWIPAKAGWNYYQYNIDASSVYGCGWATEAARGYYPDSKLYYDGKPTWGGSSWDNQALFDDQGHPLQSLKMYQEFLNGYTSPNYSVPGEGKDVTSDIQLKVMKVWNEVGNVTNPLQSDTIVSATDVNGLLNATITKLLTGKKETSFSTETLNQLADSLAQNGLQGTKEYTDTQGNKYHYVFWLDGQTAADKQWQVNNANKGVKYGQIINLPVTATLTLDK